MGFKPTPTQFLLKTLMVVAFQSLLQFKIILRLQLLTLIGVTCNGRNDGEILFSTTGGVNPATYNWSKGWMVGSNPKNLVGGTLHYNCYR